MEEDKKEIKAFKIDQILIIYFGSFFGGMILTCLMSGKGAICFIAWYPSGILLALGIGTRDIQSTSTLSTIGSVIYICFFLLALKYRENTRAKILIAIWIFLILLNIKGCTGATNIKI